MAKRKCCIQGCKREGKLLTRIWKDNKEHYVGYACGPKHRAVAQEDKRRELSNVVEASDRTCESVVAEYLSEYAERHKASSLDTAQQSLKAFRAEFGERPIASITRQEAKAWARTVPKSYVPNTVSLFAWALDEEIIATNPFRKLGHRGKGRSEKAPPTIKEFKALLDACDAVGPYAPRMRDFLEFASFTLMRPSELYELRWSDIDFASNQIHKERRLYRGVVDVPKTGRKTIPLPPPARAILLRQPTRAGELVFLSKQGKRLTAPTFSQYFALVKARSGLDFVPYEATKHYGVHALYDAGVSARTIGKLAGWSEADVEAMLRVYGHADVAAQAEIDRLYERPSQAEVEAFNDWMRQGAREEIEDGSSCRVPRTTVKTTDEEFAEWDEAAARANLDSWREAGDSEAEIERRFQNFTPPIRAAYYRITDAETEARGWETR
jgi:integrase